MLYHQPEVLFPFFAYQIAGITVLSKYLFSIFL